MNGMENRLRRSVVLMGIKHCGKSTHGKKLARELGCLFFDADDEIHEVTGKTAREIYTEQGESGFMKAEAEACRVLAEKAAGSPCVIAAGGGICNNSTALAALHACCVFVFMDVRESAAADRIVREAVPDGKNGFTNLPAYIAKENPHSERDVRAVFHRFYVDRVSKYKSIADCTVTMTGLSVKNNAACISTALAQAGVY